MKPYRVVHWRASSQIAALRLSNCRATAERHHESREGTVAHLKLGMLAVRSMEDRRQRLDVSKLLQGIGGILKLGQGFMGKSTAGLLMLLVVMCLILGLDEQPIVSIVSMGIPAILVTFIEGGDSPPREA